MSLLLLFGGAGTAAPVTIRRGRTNAALASDGRSRAVVTDRTTRAVPNEARATVLIDEP